MDNVISRADLFEGMDGIQTTHKLSVLIPASNEQETIHEILHRVQAVDLARFGVQKEVIIVDDGSTDNTYRVIQENNGYDNVSVLRHEHNRGKGAAVSTALENATGDILLIQDADLEYDPQDYPILLKPILEGRSKVVYGSDGYGAPEINYIGAKLAKRAIGQALGNLVDDGLLSEVEARQAAGFILAENARRLYKLDN